MIRYIRWQGAATGVLLVVTLLLGTWLLLNPLLRWVLVESLEEAVGAEVNILAVEHQLSPAQITIRGLQVTDANKPTNNLVDVSSVSFGFEWLPLLTKKVHISELTVTGLQMNQTRTSPGAVYREATSAEDNEDTDASWMKTEPVNVDDIIAKAPLKTPQALAHLTAVREKHEAALAERKAGLPTQSDIDALKQKIAVLQSQEYKTPADFALAKKRLDEIKAEVKRNNNVIKAFKEAVQAASSEIKPALKAARQAPQQDLAMVKGIAAGDTDTINNVAQQMFGNSVNGWAEPILISVNHILPLLKGSREEAQKTSLNEGYFVSLDETTPDIFIEQALVEVIWQQQTLMSQWFDVTYQHDITQKPTRFTLQSSGSTLWQTIEMNGEFSIIAEQLKLVQQWNIEKLNLESMIKTKSKEHNFSLSKGLLSSTGSLDMKDNQLMGQGQWNINQLSLASTESNDVVNALIDGVNRKGALALNTDFSGSWQQPSIRLSSDLDGLLTDIVSQHYLGEHSAKLSQWKQSLTQSSSSEISGTDELLGGWQNVLGENANFTNQLTELLGADISQGGSLEDKLKDKLRSKLFGG